MTIMQTATLTPAFVNPPRGNARSASIKDANGEYWSIPPEMQSQFQKGVEVTVMYDTNESGGRTYKNIKTIAKAAAPVVQAATNGHAPIGHNSNGAALPQDRGGVPPHVSNWVAHAIATGKIQDAPDMIRWAQWAYQAGLSMTSRPTDAAEDAPF